MKNGKKRSMDLSEDILRLAISEHMKDLDEKDLNMIYRTIINLRKKK